MVGFWPTFLLVDPNRQVAELIEPTLVDMGFELVRVLLHGGHRPTLQVMAERIDRTPMTVERCAEISRAVSAILDVADPIEGTYQLEVTSPGLDRPLTRRDDFERFRGFEARVETDVPIEGRRRFRGRLLGVVDDRLRLELTEGEQVIPCDTIKKAKLIVTEELLAAAAAEQRS
ncbi:MAG: ribosome maturation factor RimP [Pseudomonadota bacterium]